MLKENYVIEFEDNVLDIYGKLFRSELTQEQAWQKAQRLYNGLPMTPDGLRLTDDLDHETVCIMYDLGVILSNNDPLLKKGWFVVKCNNPDNTRGLKEIKNPYSQVAAYNWNGISKTTLITNTKAQPNDAKYRTTNPDLLKKYQAESIARLGMVS